MSLNVPRIRYDGLQRLFHWTMAAMIFAAIAIGVYCTYLPRGVSPRHELLDIHKSLGMTVLILLPLRLIYRLIIGEPPHVPPLTRANHAAALAAHLSLYGLMFFMPLTGYILSAAGGYNVPWFGLFVFPRLAPLDKALSSQAGALHYLGAWAICFLLAAHVVAVIWHVKVKRDNVLARMT